MYPAASLLDEGICEAERENSSIHEVSWLVDTHEAAECTLCPSVPYKEDVLARVRRQELARAPSRSEHHLIERL